MKTLALEVKKAVRKGKDIKQTYTDMVGSTIRIAKAMKYPGAGQVTTKDILPSIKDIECNAWRKHLEGKTKMNPEDLYDEQEEEHPADQDLSAELDKIVRKRIKEVKERLENERLAREAGEKRTTRSQSEAGTSKDPVPLVPETRKRKRPEETVRKETGGKAPKKTESDVKKTKKSEDSGQTAEKRPKTKTTNKTPQVPQHIDEEDYKLDLRTGKFVRKEKQKVPAKAPTKQVSVQKIDESRSRRKDKAGAVEETIDTGDVSRNRKKKKSVTFTEEEANDNDDDNLEIVDDEDLDKNYEPGQDDDNDDDGDDENYQAVTEDLDDFDIPPLRPHTKSKVVAAKIKPKSTQRRVASTDEGIGDETLSLFQRIIGDSFVVRATEEFEEESKEKHDRC